MEKLNFSEKLGLWYKENKRDLPWRGVDNPYFTWLSEILLQQTRVEQGLDYYLKFISHFPKINLLAEANEEEILKLWQGLGYYSRARNLHFASKQIMNDHNGKFPDKYEDILKLKGIGPYSAAAIASIAFKQVYPAVDGNVLRVISRIFGVKTPVDSTLGKKEIYEILYEVIDKNNPGTFNEALMELGALICKPQSPVCNECVFIKECYAYNNNSIGLLPIKTKTVKQRDRFFYYLIFNSKNDNIQYIYLNKRIEKDIWKNMYDFPLIENEIEILMSTNDIFVEINKILKSDKFTIKSISNQYKHKLSHQTIYARFIEIELNKDDTNYTLDKYLYINFDNIHSYPIPKLVENYLKVRK